VAIKLVTRVFEKIQFAKRALREITLLRHFSHHGNITGLIDVDAISPDFTEMYVPPLCSFPHLIVFLQLYIHGGTYRLSQELTATHGLSFSQPMEGNST